jgi:hypothetical protein
LGVLSLIVSVKLCPPSRDTSIFTFPLIGVAVQVICWLVLMVQSSPPSGCVRFSGVIVNSPLL